MKRSSGPEPEGSPAEQDAAADEAGLGESPGGAAAEEMALEAEAAAAEAWLAGCREAAARGESTHDVDAGPIEDPALAGLVEQVTAAVDGLVGLDAAGRDGEALLETVVELRRQSQRLAGAVAQVTAAYEASKEWRLKARSAAGRLSHRCRAPRGEMRGQVKLGRDLLVMPLVDQALTAGEIAVCHARRLGLLATNTRTAEAFTPDEELLVGFAKTLEWPAFCAAIAYWLHHVDPDGAEDNAAADDANRRVHLSEGIDGTGILDGILTPVGYATVREALDRIYEELFQDDWAEAREALGREPTVDELTRTPSQRRHDALVRMAELSQTADRNGKRPLPLLSILVGLETLTGRVCEIENTGAPVTPGTVARLLNDYDDVEIERALFDAPNRLVELSERRLFTGTLRRAVQLRDRHCQWPGCHEPAVRCEVDHIVPDCEAGPTSLDNGQPLCGGHNRLKERIRKLMARRRRRHKPAA